MVQEGWLKGAGGCIKAIVGRVAEKSSIHGSQGKAWFLDKNPG